MKGSRRLPFFLTMGSVLLVGVLVLIFFFTPLFQPWLQTLTKESRRILGLKESEISPEEIRIREEVILKKAEEAIAQIDWRQFAPEYPKPRTLELLTEKERMKVFKETPEFKEMDREVKEYARKKEDLLTIDPPLPSTKEAIDFTHLKDKATEKIIQRLLSMKERIPQEKALEENLRLGIKGPLVFRKILEKPLPLQVKVRVDTEIELTLWVLPDGVVDRAIPSMKGDTELERIAIQYLKQWRFAPLPKDQPQVEQWGTIPIKFKLQ